MIPNYIPVLIEITELPIAKRGLYKIGDLVIGGRSLKDGKLSSKIWVCYDSGKHDFDVFELGIDCRIWNIITKKEAELINVSAKMNTWFEFAKEEPVFTPNKIQFSKH